IGQLLRAIDPPQFYSHEGLMTRNYIELKHTTASEARYGDYGLDVGDSDARHGIRPEVLKYGWQGSDPPGPDSGRSIGQAFNGYALIDPENQPTYQFHSFSFEPQLCGGDTFPVSPVVVRPPPGSDSSVRDKLKSAADTALGIRTHYRFYAYTLGSIGTIPD